MLHQKPSHSLQHPLGKATILLKITHVAPVGEGDPADARNELEERLLADFPRCIELAVIHQSRGCDVGQPGDARPVR